MLPPLATRIKRRFPINTLSGRMLRRGVDAAA